MRILAIGDFHAGHLLGLTPPKFQRHDTPYARTLWDYFTAAVRDRGPWDVVIANGDLVDGPGRRDTTKHLTTDMHAQTDMAVEALRQTECSDIRIVRGTGYHTDYSCNFEDFVADALGVPAYDDLPLEIHGRRFHFRHHVGRSDIPYGQYTQLGKEKINEALQAEFEGYDAADVIVRSHVHYCVRTGVADAHRGIMREAITLPALQLRGPEQSSYTRQLRTWLYHVGITEIVVSPDGLVWMQPHPLPIVHYAPRRYECLTPTTGSRSLSRSRKTSRKG